MFTGVKKALILVCALALAIPLYAQNEVSHNKEAELKPSPQTESPQEEYLTETPAPAPAKKLTTRTFFDFIDKKVFADTIDKSEEKKILREKWKRLLGVDVFYPYFKAKEVEKWVRDRTRVKLFSFRGRAKFERNKIIYTFKLKF